MEDLSILAKTEIIQSRNIISTIFFNTWNWWTCVKQPRNSSVNLAISMLDQRGQYNLWLGDNTKNYVYLVRHY